MNKLIILLIDNNYVQYQLNDNYIQWLSFNLVYVTNQFVD